MKQFIRPLTLQPKDKVAIVSPSSGCAHLFPWVYELGIERLRQEFDLIPVEFPTARQTPDYLAKNPAMRAQDINDAFADSTIKAIIATSGGYDEIRILPYLNKDILINNPKIFLGYSDNTNIHLYLYNLGIISYYGCSVMSQLAMQAGMHDYTKKYIRKALFETEIGEIVDSPVWTDADLDWAIQENLAASRPLENSPGWVWQNFNNQEIKGRLFGGCLEVLELHLAVDSYFPKSFDDIVLYIETSEELPTAGFVYRFLAALGERGLLQKLKALLVAIPKTQFLDQLPPGGREHFMAQQRHFINKALDDYGIATLPTIFNLHFGHVDPQMIIPNGSMVTINGNKKKMFFN
jgi:muramoyltetrapeptide carboxypeptidase LdcA involved in peptidoglycan recycling